MCLCLKELLLISFLAYVKLGSHLLSQKHSLLIEKWNSSSLKAEQQDLEGGGMNTWWKTLQIHVETKRLHEL